MYLLKNIVLQTSLTELLNSNVLKTLDELTLKQGY